jgi:hypothetical protein
MEILFRGKESCRLLFPCVPCPFCLLIECFLWQMLANFVERENQIKSQLASLATDARRPLVPDFSLVSLFTPQIFQEPHNFA